jgi:hypothetical protein
MASDSSHEETAPSARPRVAYRFGFLNRDCEGKHSTSAHWWGQIADSCRITVETRLDKHDTTDLEELTRWASVGIIVVGLAAGSVVIGLALLAPRAAV